MTEHPKAWTSRLSNGALLLWTSKPKSVSHNCVEVRLVPVDDYDEMMRAWEISTGKLPQANIGANTETTDDG